MTQDGVGDKDLLIHEIGSMVLASEDFATRDWDSLTLVLKFKDGRRGIHGYKYAGRSWVAATAVGFEISEKLVELRETMAKESGEHWNWALLTIVAPAMTIALEFSYDDENPWDLGTKSLDLSDYALSLRSPDHPSESNVDVELSPEWTTPAGR